MTFLPRLVLGLLLLFHPVILGAVPAWADDDEGYDDGQYDEAAGPDDEAPDPEELAPYGSWVDDGQYGRVWHPAVSVGWAPYVDGYWAWTPYGWTWVSYEPWAWTFHYGRWALLPVGWVWVPGHVWGPAWVDWFWADGFVGWAPLSPFGTHVTVINQFVFVHERDFCSRRLDRTVVDHHLVPHRVIDRWQHRGPGRERPPGLHHIERVSQRPITRLDHKPPGTIAPRHFGERQQLVRPGGNPRLGGARRGDAGLRPGAPGGAPRRQTRLGQPWRPGRAPGVGRPPLIEQGGQLPRSPRLARPSVEPRLGTARRGGVSPSPSPTSGNVPRRQSAFGGVARPPMRRAERPSLGGARPAPPAVPGGGFGMPGPG
ncbi:MAG TPA: DUF6600 domain-containing protein, partial [Candidatus Binatus sp.]|nr:DUF6600 domain-containing protein [Candidatus Binatus sp.]